MKTGVVDIAGVTDTGRLRRVNQDDWYVDATRGLFAVADGMGGHAHGEEASQLALNVLREHLPKEGVGFDDQSRQQLIIDAVSRANATIFQQNTLLGHTAGTGMGTTLTGLYRGPAIATDAGHPPARATPGAGEHRSVLFNVGDSRVYRWRNSQLELLTRDHTVYREWQEAGGRGTAPPRNIILRALGLFATVEVDVRLVDDQDGDVYLLCSDGLNDMLEHSLLEHCLAQSTDATAATLARRLVDAANQAGGEDNITVIIMKHPSAREA